MSKDVYLKMKTYIPTDPLTDKQLDGISKRALTCF